MIEITDSDGIEAVLAKLKEQPEAQTVLVSRGLFLYLLDHAMGPPLPRKLSPKEADHPLDTGPGAPAE